jgi:hypothetical protein
LHVEIFLGRRRKEGEKRDKKSNECTVFKLLVPSGIINVAPYQSRIYVLHTTGISVITLESIAQCIDTDRPTLQHKFTIPLPPDASPARKVTTGAYLMVNEQFVCIVEERAVAFCRTCHTQNAARDTSWWRFNLFQSMRPSQGTASHCSPLFRALICTCNRIVEQVGQESTGARLDGGVFGLGSQPTRRYGEQQCARIVNARCAHEQMNLRQRTWRCA